MSYEDRLRKALAQLLPITTIYDSDHMEMEAAEDALNARGSMIDSDTLFNLDAPCVAR